VSSMPDSATPISLDERLRRYNQPRVGDLFLVGDCEICRIPRMDELEGAEWNYALCSYCRSLPYEEAVRRKGLAG
jgi:hypothetical protein